MAETLAQKVDRRRAMDVKVAGMIYWDPQRYPSPLMQEWAWLVLEQELNVIVKAV